MKKNKKISLEKEFEQRKRTHKWDIIAAALMKYENKGIYNSPLLIDRYGDLRARKRGNERAYDTADDLEKRSDNGDIAYYDTVYEMCWKKMRNKIDDQIAYYNTEED